MPAGGQALGDATAQGFRAADDFRKLRSNFSLMLQLLIRDAYRGWETINTDSPRLQAVTAEDLQRVAKKYFTSENRTVATYYRATK